MEKTSSMKIQHIFVVISAIYNLQGTLASFSGAAY